jgi:peptidoglycan-associated lipoprotein
MSVLKLPLVLSLAAVALAGCAKTAMTTSASAPAPAPVARAAARSAPRVVTPAPARAAARSVAAAAPRPSEFVATDALRDIHFDFDRYDIRADDAKVLDANAAWLTDNARALVLVEGHADERGTNEYNLALGERRARAALDYLVSRGVRSARISVVSYGEERPRCAERTEACWAQNRRAHFLVKPE